LKELTVQCHLPRQEKIADRTRYVLMPVEDLVTEAKSFTDSLPDESLLLLDDGHHLRDHALAGYLLKNHKKIHNFAANSLQMLLQMVENDLGVTLVPDMALGLLDNTHIKTIRLPIKEFYRDIGFGWRKGHSRQSILEAIMSRLEPPPIK
jgi:DNA-binding transcriptional LysR family regulator